ANRRRRRFHRTDLHSGSVRSQKSFGLAGLVRQIKRVLFVAGRMVCRGIQSVEAVPLGFYVWTFGERKTHSPENLNSALMHLVKRMQRTNVAWRPRKRDVDASERVGFFFGTNFFSVLIKCSGNSVPRLVEQLADDRAFLFTERFHPLAPFGD